MRAFEELRKLGYDGSYSTLRNTIRDQRSKPKAPVIRFETLPGAQAQMDWSTYTLDFTQEGRRRVELFSYILGYSRRQYIRFTERQRPADSTFGKQSMPSSWTQQTQSSTGFPARGYVRFSLSLIQTPNASNSS